MGAALLLAGCLRASLVSVHQALATTPTLVMTVRNVCRHCPWEAKLPLVEDQWDTPSGVKIENVLRMWFGNYYQLISLWSLLSVSFQGRKQDELLAPLFLVQKPMWCKQSSHCFTCGWTSKSLLLLTGKYWPAPPTPISSCFRLLPTKKTHQVRSIFIF